MDKAQSLSTPREGQSIDVKRDSNYMRPNIAFAVNLLARCSSTSTRRHWNRIKHILRYFHGTTNLRLFYPNRSNPHLVGYANAGYLFDPHIGQSQK